MANKILVARGTKARLEEIKSTLAVNELVYSTDTGELGVKKANGNIEYFKNAADIDAIETSKQDKLTAGNNITINPVTNVISASGVGGGGEVDLDEMAYFNYASRIYGDRYSLLVSAWEHSLTVDPDEISENSRQSGPYRGKAQYPNGETEGVIIPQGVTRIGNYAFEDWPSNNQPLVIPNSVTEIGTGAFHYWNSNKHPIIIPDSVTYIGSVAFEGWSNVPYIEMKSETPPTLGHSTAFGSGPLSALIPIYVPDGSVDDYKTLGHWSYLRDQILPISDKELGGAPADDKLYGRKNNTWEEVPGGIALSTVSIPFTEVLSQTQTTIAVVYNYIGDDPVNFTADFSNFTLGDGLTLVMPGIGTIPISAAVGAIFGKTTLNYFEIIILFRYIISATLMGAITDDSSLDLVLIKYYNDYRNFLSNVFKGINNVNIDSNENIIATFTVDFIMFCQDIPFYNTVTGRGSSMGVTVETVGDIDETPLVYTGVDDKHFGAAWENLVQSNGLIGYTNYYIRYIGGMTLKLYPFIKMKVNYNGGMFLD